MTRQIFLKLTETLIHFVDTFFLLFHIGMNIEIECCSDVGVSENNADSLIVAHTLDATCREAVA